MVKIFLISRVDGRQSFIGVAADVAKLAELPPDELANWRVDEIKGE